MSSLDDSNNEEEVDAAFQAVLARATDDNERKTLRQWRLSSRCPGENGDKFVNMLTELNNNAELLSAYVLFFGRSTATTPRRSNLRGSDSLATNLQTPRSEPPPNLPAEELLLADYHVPPAAAASAEEATATHHASPVDLLDKALNGIIDKLTHPHPAPFLPVVQSTGYGKTRAVLELAKRRKVVYLPWKVLEGSWSVPPLLSELLSQFQGMPQNLDTEPLCETKWLRFLTAVITCASAYNSPEELYNAQIMEDRRLGDFYVRLKKEWTKLTSPDHSPFRRPILKQDGAAGDSNREKGEIKKVHYDDAEKIDHNSIVVCLDEVTALPNFAFRAYRRAAKYKGVLSIFCDTAASICQLASSKDHSSSLNGGSLGFFSPPIYEMSTLDIHWDAKKGDDDYPNLFCAGRPRWWSHYQVRLRKNNNETQALLSLISLAENLLTGRSEVVANEPMLKVSGGSINRVDPGMVAIFACRYFLGKSSKLSSLLAKHSLATITHVSSDRDVVECTYPSEPILAEASARYTKDDEKLKTVLSHVMASFHNEPKLLEAPRGDVGEMCAAALLGITMDSIRQDLNHESMSEAVPLDRLLSVFQFPDKNVTAGRTIAKEWTVNFTHFVRPWWVPLEADLLFMWKRRMAYYVPVGVNGLDLLIAIKRKDEDVYGTLRVQVKNYSDKIAAGKRAKILSKLWPGDCPPLFEKEVFSVGLLICLGEVDSFCSLYNYDNRRRWPDPRRSEATKPERLVLQLATSFPDVGMLNTGTCFRSVALAVPLLLQISTPSREDVPSSDFEHDSLYRKIIDHHHGDAEKKRKFENSDNK
jgi:hypothetical protein